MPTTREVFEAKRHLFRPVPRANLVNVCSLCFAAIEERYTFCYNCNAFRKTFWGVWGDRLSVVPMTIVENPSDWYFALLTYKQTQFREHGPTLGALAYEWLTAHRADLPELLGGEPTHTTIVPSKKGRTTFETQPLRRALALVQKMEAEVQELLRCAAARSTRLMACDPGVFETVADVDDARIVLIEDTWITGSTALSAAGALLEAGAASVVITPIAREMKKSFHGEDHPYRKYIAGEYDLHSWPR